MSDPGARARSGPAPVPEGSLTPWLSLSLQPVGQCTFGGEKRRVLCRIARARIRLRSSGKSGSLFVQKMLPANTSRSRVVAGQWCPGKWWLTRAAFDVDLWPS